MKRVIEQNFLMVFGADNVRLAAAAQDLLKVAALAALELRLYAGLFPQDSESDRGRIEVIRELDRAIQKAKYGSEQ